MLSIKQFTFNDFSENTYILFDETKEAIIIDPGCYYKHETDQLLQFIAEKELKPVKLLNTHCHIDHILGNHFVMDYFKLPLHLHQEEIFTYKDTKRWTSMFNMPDLEIPENLIFIDETSTITFGNQTLQCLFTPGHSIASLTFYSSEASLAIVGDVIMQNSIGRTDLPGGNFTTLLQSIQTKIFTLPSKTTLFSGHGPKTTAKWEKENNPFLK